ncbi:hypothetical protein Tco_0798563 [Tanacetum coccineum]
MDVAGQAAVSPVLENMFDEAFRKSEKMIRRLGVKSINGIDAYRVFDESFARIGSLVTRESQQTLSPRIKHHSEQLNVGIQLTLVRRSDLWRDVKTHRNKGRPRVVDDGFQERGTVNRVVSDGTDIQYVGSTSIELEGENLNLL